MYDLQILYPTFVLVFLTFGVTLAMPLIRFRAVKSEKVDLRYFKYYETRYEVPASVMALSNHYNNLFQMPILFYIVSILIMLTNTVDTIFLQLAWAYVAMRLLHSIIHLSYNHVMHRLIPFALSTLILLVLWFRLFLSIGQPIIAIQ
tara:strand:- start:11887 stop:12327 length:441 start_codon:yes stop_codon:yes gene_type:complete